MKGQTSDPNSHILTAIRESAFMISVRYLSSFSYKYILACFLDPHLSLTSYGSCQEITYSDLILVIFWKRTSLWTYL